MSKRGKILFAEVHRSAVHLHCSPALSTHAARFFQPEPKTSSCVLLGSLRREQQQSSALDVFQIDWLRSAWGTWEQAGGCVCW